MEWIKTDREWIAYGHAALYTVENEGNGVWATYVRDWRPPQTLSPAWAGIGRALLPSARLRSM